MPKIGISTVSSRVVLGSLGICWALVFSRCSVRFSSEIHSFRAWREKGAYGFRLIKTNRFLRFFHVARLPGAQPGR
ncbi:MAG: hypothetical protein VYC88_11470, partial [SAR324 cluster bacterium]|nr:hypothetical protein [SAR324 cluster bacterium]